MSVEQVIVDTSADGMCTVFVLLVVHRMVCAFLCLISDVVYFFFQFQQAPAPLLQKPPPLKPKLMWYVHPLNDINYVLMLCECMCIGWTQDVYVLLTQVFEISIRVFVFI